MMLVTSTSSSRPHGQREAVSRTASTRSTSSGGDGPNLSAYDKCIYSQSHDPRWQKESMLGRRIGLYRFRGELGQGNFSTVRLAFHQITRDKVAIKVIEKCKLDPRTQKMLAREISNMDAIAHPNIIRLFEVVESMARIHLVVEYAGGGELFNLISSDGKLKEGDAVCVFAQLLSAVSYLHSLSIVHRDIKAENVFISKKYRVKLGDLGFSTRVSELDQALTTFCGSPPYAAPELYRDASYAGPAVDVWALGILLFFILTAEMPFRANTVSSLKKHILAGAFTFPSHVGTHAQDLIKKILTQDPNERISTEGVAEHDLLSVMHPAIPHHRSPSHLSPTSMSPPPTISTPPSPTDEGDNLLLSPADAENQNTNEDTLSPDSILERRGSMKKRNKAQRSCSARSPSPRELKVVNYPSGRRHSYVPRSSSHKSSSSSYVYRAFPTAPLPHYVCSPQIDIPGDLLTEAEVEGFSLLDHWGISKTMLSEASPLGVRSPIIGTYRILLHRILNKGVESEEDNQHHHHRHHSDRRGSHVSRHRSEDRNGTRGSPSRNKLKHNDYDGHTTKSKTCVIV